jgi:hypothetical protein
MNTDQSQTQTQTQTQVQDQYQTQIQEIDHMEEYDGTILKKMSEQDIKIFNEFITNKKPSEAEAFSPKLYFMYNLIRQNLKKSPPFTYGTIGADGYRTLIMYKSQKAIYVLSLYFNDFESYYVLEEIA